VAYPVSPYHAESSALAGIDPVLFLESLRVYDFWETLVEAGVPEEYYQIDLAEPSVKRAAI
jgi:pyruvate/2-oxoglutarate/acetoin dehydrogenase E1 component